MRRKRSFAVSQSLRAASIKPTPTVQPSDGLASALERNIAALAERRKAEEEREGRDQRLARSITRFAGSMAFVYVHAAVVIGWVLVNLRLTPFAPFDPTFVILASVASVEAIFLSTFILIAQNRAAEAADRRADLDLQINLLSEHEVTHLIRLVTRIADKLGIAEAQSPNLDELKRTVAPEAVLERIQEAQGE